ncbi:ATP-binding protein, partial [Candidatus Latescibacterota bacterium]
NDKILTEREINRELIREIIDLKEQINILKKTRIQKKKAEKSIFEVEERLKFALEGAKEGLFDWNIETGEVYYSLNWNIDDTDSDIFVGKKEICIRDVPHFLHFIKAYLSNDTSYYEEEFKVKLKKTGHNWIKIHFRVAKRDREGKPLRILGTIIDITEQKQSEELFSQSEREKSIILDTISEILIYYDKDMNVQWANNAVGKNFGFNPQKIIGYSYKDFWHSRFNGNEDTIFSEVLNTGITQEKEIEDINGNYWFIRLNPIFDKNNEIIGLMEFGQDITERKRLEEEQINACKYESIKFLSNGIAHDFNNLLTLILGNITLANMQIDKGEIHRILSNAEIAIHRTKKLTDQLLAFSRGEKSIVKLLSIEEIITHSAEICLKGSKIINKILIEDDVLPIEADEGQILQLFDNLFINSIQAMPYYGTIEISVENFTVSSFENLPVEKGQYIKVSFKDNGIGISCDNIKKIFDPYFTTKQKGSGIGLTSAYSIVKRHGGYIEVESEENVGTIFYIYLPVCDKQSHKI